MSPYTPPSTLAFRARSWACFPWHRPPESGIRPKGPNCHLLSMFPGRGRPALSDTLLPSSEVPERSWDSGASSPGSWPRTLECWDSKLLPARFSGRHLSSGWGERGLRSEAVEAGARVRSGAIYPSSSARLSSGDPALPIGPTRALGSRMITWLSLSRTLHPGPLMLPVFGGCAVSRQLQSEKTQEQHKGRPRSELSWMVARLLDPAAPEVLRWDAPLRGPSACPFGVWFVCSQKALTDWEEGKGRAPR